MRFTPSRCNLIGKTRSLSILPRRKSFPAVRKSFRCVLLQGIKKGLTVLEKAESVFYIQQGRVKLKVKSKQGKEAVIAILGGGEFLGEACLIGQTVCLATAITIVPSTILRIDKKEMQRVLHEERMFSDLFIPYLLSRNVRTQEDLVDQLFNSSEQRLARTLLLLANYGKEGTPETVVPEINQETLAGMVGTTRSRVSFFMNKFKKLGLIDYKDGLRVHRSLLNIVLHD